MAVEASATPATVAGSTTSTSHSNVGTSACTVGAAAIGATPKVKKAPIDAAVPAVAAPRLFDLLPAITAIPVPRFNLQMMNSYSKLS